MNCVAIKDKYLKKYADKINTFKQCAYSEDCKGDDLVENLTQCFDFEKIVNGASKAADSLYFSSSNYSAYFIEFKNSYYYNYNSINVEKAVDSLLFHENFCDENSLDYTSIDSYFVVVYSKSKTMREVTEENSRYSYMTIMMINAHMFYTVDGKELFEDMFTRQFEIEATKKGLDTKTYTYKKFIPLLSDDFDSFIENIL